ncbi:MAG: type II secretion system protein E [Desulfuromonas sp.]|nr:type II secretion system protein E [Desulfuromonas sp.]
MQTHVIVKLLTGAEKRGMLARTLNPESDHIELYRDDESAPESHRFDAIAYVKVLGKPNLADAFGEDEFFEDVTTVTGDRFHLRLKRSERLASGFYGYPTDLDSDFKSIFFTNSGMRQRHHDRPIGEMLMQNGLVQAADVDEALTEQKRLREKRVGEILVEKNSLPETVVEHAIDNARKLKVGRGRVRVGEILIEAGLVTRKQVDEALATQTGGRRKRIGAILVERGLITEEQLLTALAQKFELQVVDLEKTPPNPSAIKRLSREMIEKMQVLPLEVRGTRLVVATSNPTDPTILENLRFVANCPIELVVASSRQIAAQIAKNLASAVGAVEDLIDELDSIDVQVEEEQEVDKVTESDSKVINLVNKVLLDAHKRGVSDIHFEPGMGPFPLKIRYRKDGICTQVHQIASTFKAAIISRLKIIAKLDIAEHRRPQSGKIMIKHGRERIEYRVEITPTIGGQEDAVLRVLSSARIYPLDQIGFSAKNLERMRAAIQKPYGIILCVGPTGSGKTTTLHSALSEINLPDRKIWTAEDPVEISQEGLRQVQVFPKIGFTFDEALRSFLRADPDVIMIGEMRDPVTAKTAIGASLTGHLVFSTLHTNSAPETVVRLIEMGMDPFNFSDAMLAIVAQRLTRRLCPECKEPYHPKRAEYDELVEAYGPEQFKRDEMPAFSKGLTLMRAKGCETCEGQGYSGRIAIHELLANSPQVKQAIKHSAGVDKIQEIGIEQGMSTLRMDGIQKIFLGLTDLIQINRVAL